MDSPQAVVSPFKASVVNEPAKQISDYSDRSSDNISKVAEVRRKERIVGNQEAYVGVLEVDIHQARDIHNICIYHKQDVYAKLCLTSDPENTVSTKIINGGGRNPVFNDSLRLNIRTLDSSLKCEIFMMSRVRNYLEDQLLGFALVPLSEVVIKKGKLEKEFSLSSTDLFHSPAGFVHLSLSYIGAAPEVMAIPAIPTALAVPDTEIQESLPCELDKIEFPDPNIVNENQMMVSEYFKISHTNDESETSETSEVVSEVGAESYSTAICNSSAVPEDDSPPSSESTTGISSPSVAASSDILDAPETPNHQEHDSAEKEKKRQDGERNSSSGMAQSENIIKPVITVPEQNVVQQDIVDMYMKSMQQFTESLAKMKLPLDIDRGPTSSASSTSDQKAPSKNSGSRVFYGSRAFF